MTTIVLGVDRDPKGKLCDILGSEADIYTRATGGRNCAHSKTLARAAVVDGVFYDLFPYAPLGATQSIRQSLIRPAVVLHVPTFFSELEVLREKSLLNLDQRLKVSTRCALHLDLHSVVDETYKAGLGEGGLSTTRHGLGPVFTSRSERTNLIVADLFDDGLLEQKMNALAQQYRNSHGVNNIDYDVVEEIDQLKPFCIDDVEYLDEAQNNNKKIVIEGARSAMLDLVYGAYPSVSSSTTTFGGVMAGMNINRRKIDDVIEVLKAYTTRFDDVTFANQFRERSHEFDDSTGDSHRCGWLDLVPAKYSQRLDILDDYGTTPVAVAYKRTAGSSETLDAFLPSAHHLARV
ncbi:Adenylosuccinate synthetase [Apodospora peruviana]|uniref:Adenylosuccinate synthetase n=1 Tax=Apodospora peruviana TaxID=516989 RepID=A0AAE0ME79_9PEZI|nr:Adenylosuccinate synthetase [Apodospora peruviana]